jgi:membrane protease YdiL (CAAX protease family)
MEGDGLAETHQFETGYGSSMNRTLPASQNGNRNKPKWKFLLFYFVMACGFAWIVWLPLILGSDGLKVFKTSFSIPVFICIGTFGPFAAAFIAYRLETGSWNAVRLLPRGRQWVWFFLGPVLVFFSLFFIFPALITKGGPSGWHWHPAVVAGIWVPMFNYNLLGGPLFEEFGWRGYLQSRLQDLLPPWIAAICVGVLWAFWHFPLFLIGWTSASPLVFTSIMVGLSIVMATAFNAAGRAVLVAIVMHSAFNSSSRFLPAFLGNVATRDHPSTEILISFSFLIVCALLLLGTRGRIAYTPQGI